MPSIVWGRDPQEAFENPYEYDAQQQFVREATKLLPALYRLLNSDPHRYTRDERTTAKAVWLLHIDALDGLFDSLDSLTTKRHRVAAQLFRVAEEALDLATLFASGTPRATRLLSRWYDDEVVPHSEYRDHLRLVEGEEAAKARAEHYARMSKFTHRTYRAIAEGYSLGGGDRLVHDRTAILYGEHSEAPTTLVLPHTLAAYHAALASLIIFFTEQLASHRLVAEADLDTAITSSLEPDTVPRRFMPSRWLRYFNPGFKAALASATEGESPKRS